jgi:hypothetical protein
VSRSWLWSKTCISSLTISSNLTSCLTSGTLSNKDGTAARMTLCHPGFTSQRWYLTNDSRIAITGGKQCLDINKNGDIQTWRCADNKHEQELKTSETPPPVPAQKCVDGKQEIVFPAIGANLTALEEANGGKFRFQYCSDNFDSSRKIQVQFSCILSVRSSLFMSSQSIPNTLTDLITLRSSCPCRL